MSRKLLISGHRGFRCAEIENTERAFQRAIDDGLDFIEFDVHKTADGIPIIFHDLLVNHLLNGTGSVENYSLSELKKLEYKDGQKIQTFEEFLNQTAGKIGLMLEVKSYKIEKEIIELLSHHRALDSTIIQSFHPSIIQKCQQFNTDPALRFGLCMRFLGNLGFFGRILGINHLYANHIFKNDVLPYNVTYLNLDGPFICDEFIKIADSHGINVILGAMRTEIYLDRLDDWKVGMINVDDPPKIVEILKTKFTGKYEFSQRLKY
jgi:glycerophosphoryl diester phosphodiesterase